MFVLLCAYCSLQPPHPPPDFAFVLPLSCSYSLQLSPQEIWLCNTRLRSSTISSENGIETISLKWINQCDSHTVIAPFPPTMHSVQATVALDTLSRCALCEPSVTGTLAQDWARLGPAVSIVALVAAVSASFHIVKSPTPSSSRISLINSHAPRQVEFPLAHEYPSTHCSHCIVVSA